jgi:hypothetical protein
MYKYLPSKKFIYIILSIILVGLIILGVKALSNRRLNTTSSDKIAAGQRQNTTFQEFKALDSDNDGLKDWEEALWKTDPNKIDTDGDGTNDAEEIKTNRDPVKPNTAKIGSTPSDQMDSELIAANKKADEEFNKLSDTEKLSRTFFSQYLASKSASGVSLTESDKQIILDTAVSMTEGSNTPKYSASDIKITNNLSSTTIKEYGNTLSQAFFTGTSQEKVANEMDIVSQAAQTEDEKILDDLNPIIESYNKTISKILLISVPTDATIMHLKFLNDITSLKTSIEKLKKLFSDPVQAISGIDSYQNSVSELRKDLTTIKNYFIKNNVLFTDKDYGYIWLNII